MTWKTTAGTRSFLSLFLFCSLLPLLPPAVANVGAQTPAVVFNAGDAGKFPPGWKSREEEARLVYAVRTEGERVFLRAESRKNGHQIGYELSTDPRRTPWLRFSWRAVGLPPGGNERLKDTNDSALGVYVIFEGWGIPPKTVKYVWSTTLPLGTTTESPFTSRVRMIVLRSGPEQLGRWIEEEVNVLEDYRRLFREDDVPKVKGIGVLTDSDNTGSSASGDYLRFAFGSERAAAQAQQP